MTDDWLRSALHEAVPEPPRSPGRLAGITERRARTKRRRALLAAGSAAAAVVLAVAIPASLRSGGTSVGPAPVAPSPTQPALNPFRPTYLPCPATQDPIDETATPLPAGAVSAQICASTDKTLGLMRDLPTIKRELLVGGVDELVAFVNQQPPPDPSAVCDPPTGPAYRLIVSYPDGTTRQVAGHRVDCVTAGDRVFGQADAVAARFDKLLNKQMRAYPNCGEVASPGAEFGDAVAAYFCIVNLDAANNYTVIGFLTDDEVATLVDDWRNRPHPGRIAEADCPSDAIGWRIAAVDSSGARIIENSLCAGGSDWDGDLGSAARAVIDGLIQRAAAGICGGKAAPGADQGSRICGTPVSTTPAKPAPPGGNVVHGAASPPALACPDLVPAYGDSTDYLKPESLPETPDVLPSDPVAVRLCAGEGMPWEPPADYLTSDSGSLAELINARPTHQRGDCKADLGRGYVLLFGYADGTTAAASGLLYGCDDLQVGGAYHDSPQGVLDKFAAALRQQRDESTPDASDLGAPPCDHARSAVQGSLFDFGEATDAVLCVRPGDSADRGTAQAAVHIPAEDLAVLVADWRGRDDPGTFQCDTSQATWSISATSAWRDPIGVTSPCGGGDWRPAAPAQAIISRLMGEATG